MNNYLDLLVIKHVMIANHVIGEEIVLLAIILLFMEKNVQKNVKIVLMVDVTLMGFALIKQKIVKEIYIMVKIVL